MIVKVVAHLSYSFGCWGLVLDRYPCQPSTNIVLHIVSFQNVLVFVVYFHHLISFDSLIVVAFNRTTSMGFVQLFFDPVSTLFGIKGYFFFIFLFSFVLRRGWWRWLRANLHIIRREKPNQLLFFERMPIPPAILEGFLHQNFVTLAKLCIFDLLLPSIFFLLFLFILLFLLFFFSKFDHLFIMIAWPRSLQIFLSLLLLFLFFPLLIFFLNPLFFLSHLFFTLSLTLPRSLHRFGRKIRQSNCKEHPCKIFYQKYYKI